MITDDQAIHWLWQQYITAMSMPEIDYWFDRFAQNRFHQYPDAVKARRRSRCAEQREPVPIHPGGLKFQ